jgi:glutathione reductase (NADPH)
METFDLIVIGVGVAGSAAAKKCAAKGQDVAVIDFRPYGGTCPLRGCDPKKVLVGAANIVDQNRRMQGKGVEFDGHINWQELIDFKRTFTEPVPESTEKGLKEAGIRLYHGKASFVNEQTLQVNGQKIKAEKILIATGNKPAPIPIDGFDYLTTSTEFMELDELSGEIAFVGGGYISFEFAHIAARAGSTVTIIHQGEQPLESFDSDMVEVLVEKSSDIGIDVRLNTAVAGINPKNGGFEIIGKDDQRITETDMAVHGAGRVPEIDGLELEKANIDRTKKGVKVNASLQSVSNDHVYAAGDAADSGGLPLTPLAGIESTVAADNILEGNHKKADYPAQPSAVFTIPPLAAVGLTEKQAQEQEIDAEVNFKRTDNWYSSRRTNETHTAFKTVINKKTGVILGAHILGQHSAELINLFTVAVNKKIPADELKDMLYAYPTLGSNISSMVS